MTLFIMYKGKTHICKINTLSIRQIHNIVYFVEHNLNKIRMRFYNKHPIPLKALMKLNSLVNANLSVLFKLNTYVNTDAYIRVS